MITKIFSLKQSNIIKNNPTFNCLVNVCDDPDNPKDCSGNGICENDDTDNGYSCYCEPGFTGKDCEEGIDNFLILIQKV